MLRRWWQRLRAPSRARDIPDDLWLDTLAAYPFLRRRTLEDLLRLRELCRRFLEAKEFTTVGELALTDSMAVAIAAQACVPVLQLPGDLDWYGGFVGIVIQPAEVQVQRSWQDEDGVVHTGEETLVGEAMPGGPVMLSWQDVQFDAGPEAASNGFNVVIHEFAHVLDMRDGDATGMPPLPDRAARSHWKAVIDAELQSLRGWLEAGAKTWLDPYAASGAEELFAVASEAFFVAPRGLWNAHPELYRLLQGFYRQDPRRHA